VTPAEHLSLPTVEDVKLGVIAARIAAHACDVVKLGERAARVDREVARARAELDWSRQMSLAIDREKAQRMRERARPQASDTCSMCGRWCALRLSAELRRAVGGAGEGRPAV
ncbi:TPA: thiamine biosynthesis protein ThiC, partial [Candidatus Bathyarchaeota archaeon]|nr:thiamine biosynthesis protein ThiC [Candidatus Bathyarchaeota archaeon]